MIFRLRNKKGIESNVDQPYLDYNQIVVYEEYKKKYEKNGWTIIGIDKGKPLSISKKEVEPVKEETTTVVAQVGEPVTEKKPIKKRKTIKRASDINSLLEVAKALEGKTEETHKRKRGRPKKNTNAENVSNSEYEASKK